MASSATRSDAERRIDALVDRAIAQHVGVNEQQAALDLHDACKNYACPDEVGARCARNLMLIMENEERRSLAGSVGITHGVRPLAALDIYRQLEHTFRNGGD